MWEKGKLSDVKVASFCRISSGRTRTQSISSGRVDEGTHMRTDQLVTDCLRVVCLNWWHSKVSIMLDLKKERQRPTVHCFPWTHAWEAWEEIKQHLCRTRHSYIYQCQQSPTQSPIYQCQRDTPHTHTHTHTVGSGHQDHVALRN
jgi:hypothetical protein